MRVYVYPADVEACGHYRLIWPAQELKRQGHDVKLIHPKHQNRIMGDEGDDGHLTGVTAPRDADVIVLQRLTSRKMLDAIGIWRKHGIAVVLDVDDDMSAIDPRNPAWGMLHPTTGGRVAEYDWHAAQRACELATFVTTTTPALHAKYAHHGRGVILPNCVPAVTLDIVHHETPRLVGWGGTVRTHPNDPPIVGPAMARLQRDGYAFGVVGPLHGVTKAFSLDRDAVGPGAVTLDRWFHELTKFAVGIAPLADTKFNHAKSWLKPLEYTALGVPWVASDVTEYRRLQAQIGGGLLVTTPKDWYRVTRRLLDDERARQDLSETGRAMVRERLTVEANAWRWWEAWTEALRIQRGGASTPFRRPLVPTTGADEGGPQAS